MALLPRVWVGVWLLSSGTSMPRCAVPVGGGVVVVARRVWHAGGLLGPRVLGVTCCWGSEGSAA